ncbi:MAG TPA: family 16 glycosylhydrolase [Bacteroidales bacterium]|nr:family 16 glycosylhydrolase [Bacteroidales bacterium]
MKHLFLLFHMLTCLFCFSQVCPTWIGKYRPDSPFPSNNQTRTSGWVQLNAFSDEFDGTQINSTKWGVHNNYCHSMSINAYFSNDPYNVHLENGALHLKAKLLNNPVSCTYNGNVTQDYPYSSGYVYSLGKIRYGYFEILCDLPYNLGLNPCFWLYGNSAIGKDDEIDVFEKDLSNNENYILLENVYGGAAYPPHRDLAQRFDFTTPFVGSDRVFAGEWLPQEINFYINGVLISSVNYTTIPDDVDAKNPFTCTDFRYAEPMQILLSLSVNPFIIPNSNPSEEWVIKYVKSFKLVDGGNTNYWPNAFNITDQYLLQVNKSLRLGGEQKTAIIPPNIN